MNMLNTIIPKVDQLTADHLSGAPITIRVASVQIDAGTDQPVTIHYEGEGSFPYRPCKSMRRVLVKVWGADANAYVGRSMTLYRDDGVKFGGLEVGGIRISHVSDIDRDVTMALTATKANKKPFTVEPLRLEPQKPKRDVLAEAADRIKTKLRDVSDQAAWDSLYRDPKVTEFRGRIRRERSDLDEDLSASEGEARARFPVASPAALVGAETDRLAV